VLVYADFVNICIVNIGFELDLDCTCTGQTPLGHGSVDGRREG